MYHVIVPTYNECENIEILCCFLKDVFSEVQLPYNIIFVDDASPDGTYDLICRLRKDHPITAIKRNEKLGLGSAYKSALRHCNDGFVIIMDADLSQNPTDIKHFIRIQQETNCDLVYGSRYNQGNVVDWSFMRKVMSRGANNLAQILLGIDITDYTNSYRLYRTSLLKTIVPLVKSNGFAFQMETIYCAASKNFKIREHPVIFYERNGGASKMGFNEVYQFIIVLLGLMLSKITGKN